MRIDWNINFVEIRQLTSRWRRWGPLWGVIGRGCSFPHASLGPLSEPPFRHQTIPRTSGKGKGKIAFIFFNPHSLLLLYIGKICKRITICSVYYNNKKIIFIEARSFLCWDIFYSFDKKKHFYYHYYYFYYNRNITKAGGGETQKIIRIEQQRAVKQYC